MKPIIGLSGGIGSGKSTVAGLFAQRGAEVIDADKLAHRELEKESVKERLQSRFGPGIINSDGSVNRPCLAEIVFADSKDQQSRAFLENCIHPGVRREIEARMAKSQAPLVVLDVPLLDASPLKKLCTHTVFIKATDEQRWNRTEKRGWSQEQWKRREASQVPLEQKEKTADIVIENTSDIENLEKQINDWINKLLSSNRGAL